MGNGAFGRRFLLNYRRIAAEIFRTPKRDLQRMKTQVPTTPPVPQQTFFQGFHQFCRRSPPQARKGGRGRGPSASAHTQNAEGSLPKFFRPTWPSTFLKSFEFGHPCQGRSGENTHFWVQFLSDKAILPARGTPCAAGYNLCSAINATIPARGGGIVLTELAVAIPEETFAKKCTPQWFGSQTSNCCWRRSGGP